MTFDGNKNRNISSENKGQVLLVIPFYDQREEPPLDDNFFRTFTDFNTQTQLLSCKV